MRCVELGGCGGFVGYFDSAKVLADLGYCTLFDKEFLDDTIIGTRDLDARLVTLDFTQRVKGVYRRGWLNVPNK